MNNISEKNKNILDKIYESDIKIMNYFICEDMAFIEYSKIKDKINNDDNTSSYHNSKSNLEYITNISNNRADCII